MQATEDNPGRIDEASQRGSSRSPQHHPEFVVKDCSLLTMTMGLYAQNLHELSEHLETIHRGCLYHHFWANRLLPRFERPDFQNDLAIWTRNALHDHPLSEKLGIINPTRFPDLEALRREVIDIIEERLEETETTASAERGQEFFFIRSQIVVFDTRLRLRDPRELCDVVPQLSVGSIYYHFIDARRRLPESTDDFSSWLTGCGTKYEALIHGLKTLDPYFVSLTELRERVFNVIDRFFRC